jgi:hypothetical protein
MNMNLPERLESRIERIPESGCWIWTGSMSFQGYGHITESGKVKKAHRVVYEASGKIIPHGLFLDHLCRVRACVNPAHLEPVTHRTNVLRGISFAAFNAKKEFCDNGHQLTEDNLVNFIKDRRQCKKCWAKYRRETKRRTRARRMKPVKANNKSGHTGVRFHKAANKWSADIQVNKVRHFLGVFDLIEDAIRARKEAEAKFKPGIIVNSALGGCGK